MSSGENIRRLRGCQLMERRSKTEACNVEVLSCAQEAHNVDAREAEACRRC